MAGTQLTPEKITSPFQLMAAWFAMLVLLISVLLTAATNISRPDWAAGYLVVFSSVVVLVVIACVTLMLTKFRPHLQEGKEYAEWLKEQNRYSSGYVVKNTLPLRKARPQAATAAERPDVQRKSFQISMVAASGSAELLDKLRNAGFNAEVYQPNFAPAKQPLDSLKRNESIWVGARIDPRAAIEAIKIAVSQWPDLKYLHLSCDIEDPPDFVHDQLFLGGASSTAEEYGLQAWSKDELLSLDEGTSAKAFHAAVRSKYS